MLIKKRQRDRISKMSTDESNEINQHEAENNIQQTPNQNQQTVVREIPGYYFDYEKNKYFLITNDHTKRFSDYLQEKDKKIITEIEHITKIQKSKSKIIDINKLFQTNKQSLFHLISNSKFMDKNEINFSKSIMNLKTKQIHENIIVQELKLKQWFHQFVLFNFQNHDFVMTFDNSLNKTKIFIEKIISDNENKPTINVSSLRYFEPEYKNSQFSSVKIIDDFLILIYKEELFFICLNEIFYTQDKLKVFHHKFQIKKTPPQTFKWPIIKKLSKNNEYLLLFYRSK